MMDKKTFDEMDKGFKGAIQNIIDCVNSEDFNANAAMMGARLVNASKNGKGRVSLEFDAPRVIVDMSGNEGALIIAMQQLIEHFGVEKSLGLIAAIYYTSPKTVNILNKTFETDEEKEVFKRVMNMSEEEREKIKNEL
jgi:hypothetical protein